MKRFIIILWGIMLISTTLFAQIESTKSLARCATNVFQSEEVVVIDGVTFSADLKTLITYPADKTDEKYVIPEGTEVIAEEAFFENLHLCNITIPSTLKEIGSHAFINCSSLTDIVWGAYPDRVGQDIFWLTTPITNFSITPDNHDCIIKDGILYSIDCKRLLKAPSAIGGYHYFEISEGTEVICKGAFELADIPWITLPSSLKKIEDFAFWIKIRIPTRSYDYEDNYMKYRSPNTIECQALVPPEIIGNPFALERGSGELVVPEESYEAYSYAPGWKEFRYINGKRPASIDKALLFNTNARVEDQVLIVTSDKNVAKIKLFDQEGKIVLDNCIGMNSCCIGLDHLSQNLLLLEVVYDNSMSQVFKLYK